ncbi:4Fe-4S binding protein [bacterium]|nr:4Fe-4S binding protein [bacterium]
MLLDLLEQKKCFKLVCGAGNEDPIEVKKLVTLYSKAGCNFFDICAKPEIIDAAKTGLNEAGIKENRYLCCSVGIKGDPHVSKALINSEQCDNCGKCKTVCPQNAVDKNSVSYNVNKTRCIGCSKCVSLCHKQAVSMISESKDLKETLPPIIEKGIDCIEFHASGTDEQEIDEKWNDINNLYDGTLSICIDRSKLGNEGVRNRINRMLERRKPYTTIIQADGCPMSGENDDFKTTLQAVAMAEIFQNAGLPVYLMLSGGTNSKSTELASLCGINFGGVAIGSYARKIVRKYIDRDDFLENKEIFNRALDIAKNLVDVSLRNIK